MPFSRMSCFLADLGSVGDDEDGDVSSKIAGNRMLPIKMRTRSRRAVECLGAIRDAASTVTDDHFGGARGETRDARGDQWSVVDGIGSVSGASGVSWRKTNGDRTINNRLPSDVVISRSSS